MKVDTLRMQLDGEVALPGDAGYADAVAIWNAAITRRPAMVVRCKSARDVSAALRFARAAGLEVSVRGGGHNFAGFALCEGGLMIDLSLMRDVAVDAASGRARCGGGARWVELDAACQAHGLAVPGGFVSHTGVAGLTLGGGFGWLTQKAGLSCDNLVSAQVVTADGSVVRAFEGEHADLFWALRGGGGNFGVVTEFEFKTTPVGPLVQLALFFYGLEQGTEMMRFARDYSRDLPEDFTLFMAGLNAPPAPFVPADQHFKPAYCLALLGLGDAQAHAARLVPIRQALASRFDFVTPIPFAQLQQLFDGSAPWGTLAYEKAAYLDELSDEAIAVITQHVPKKSSPLSFVPIFNLGGAFARTPEASVAFGGRRSTRFIVNIAAMANDRELLASETAWCRTFWSALLPHTCGQGSYVNFMSEHDDTRVRSAYGPTKYRRLAEIKAKYDPDNVLHLNANITPAK